ncbi:hypothetical protein MTO96_048663 [Rhipicephalus appendiculatus]
MQVQQNSDPAPLPGTFTPFTDWVLKDIAQRQAAAAPTASSPLDTEDISCDGHWTTVTSKSKRRTTLKQAEDSWHPRYAPRLNPDGYVAVIKPRVTCNFAAYKGQCIFAEAIHAALLQAAANTPDLQIDFTQYGLYPVWDQNIIVINTPNEALIHHFLNISALKFPDRTVPVHSYLKPTDKMGRGVIRLANHISTDYIVQRTVSPGNKVIGTRRLGTTNVVVLTFEHADIPRNVLVFGEDNPVQRYRKTIPTCSNCGKVGHRTDVCPNPTAPSSRCPTCGKTGVDLANHECLACCLLCNGAHITGARECPKRYRRPVGTPSRPASSTRGDSCERTSTSNNGARSRSGQRSTFRGRSSKGAPRAPSRSKSRSKSRSSSRPKQALQQQTTQAPRSSSQGPSQTNKTSVPPVSWAEIVAPTQARNDDDSQSITQLQKMIATQQQMLMKQKHKIEQLEQLLKSRKSSEPPPSTTQLQPTASNMETDTQAPSLDPGEKPHQDMIEQIVNTVVKVLTPLLKLQISEELQQIRDQHSASIQQIKEQSLASGSCAAQAT